VYVSAVIGDIRTVYPNVAIPNIGNAMLQECTTGSSSNFVCGILRDTSLSNDEKTRILNSVANIAFAGGVMGVSYGDLTTALDSIDHHLSFDSDNFNGAGYLWDANRGAKIWIDVNGGWSHSKGLASTGIYGNSYRTSNYGFVLGIDKRLENTDVVLGGAFSFNDGNLKSSGGVIGTKNNYQSYGAHIYANWSPTPVVNLIGSVNCLHNSSDINQTIGVASFNNASAKVQSNLVSVGIRAESSLRVKEAIQFIPHVEARYIWSKSGNYDTKIDGQKLWANSPKANSLLQIPIGVAYRGDFATNSGWALQPSVDVSIIPQLGSGRQSTTLNYRGSSDTVTGQFMGNLGYQLKLGVLTERGNASVGVLYGFTGGNKGRADQSVKIIGRLKF
ncbi:MAG: autotransporter outer membrane beta-barrel domain-containing protein, partial [Burkholderiales bacterium]|nr:autotransporter outer membrane beta-barrel domain-containing protein [Burkholderiales bacterium]